MFDARDERCAALTRKAFGAAQRFYLGRTQIGCSSAGADFAVTDVP